MVGRLALKPPQNLRLPVIGGLKAARPTKENPILMTLLDRGFSSIVK